MPSLNGQHSWLPEQPVFMLRWKEEHGISRRRGESQGIPSRSTAEAGTEEKMARPGTGSFQG